MVPPGRLTRNGPFRAPFRGFSALMFSNFSLFSLKEKYDVPGADYRFFKKIYFEGRIGWKYFFLRIFDGNRKKWAPDPPGTPVWGGLGPEGGLGGHFLKKKKSKNIFSKKLYCQRLPILIIKKVRKIFILIGFFVFEISGFWPQKWQYSCIFYIELATIAIFHIENRTKFPISPRHPINFFLM